MTTRPFRALVKVPLLPVCLLIVMVGGPSCRSRQDREAAYLKKGAALMSSKDYARALLEFRNASGAMPKDPEPYYQMGLAYLQTRDGEAAAHSFQQAVALNPRHSAAQLKLAELMTGAKNTEVVQDAASRLQEVLESSPDTPEAIDALALAEWKLGRPDEAARRLQEALKKYPTDLQAAVTLAQLKLSKQDWKGAEEVLKTLATQAPQSSPAALGLGELYFYLREPTKAETELRRAVQLDPTNGLALVALGTVQISAKRMDEAEQTYQRIASLPDKEYKPLHAVFLYRFGNRDAAIAEFEALVKAAPNDRDARTRMVAAYFSSNRISDAERVLNGTLRQNPKDTDALLQRAELRVRFGKPDEAEKDLKDFLHYRPDSAKAHFVLGVAYKAKGQDENQRQEFQQALALDPALLSARLALETSYIRANQGKAALELMDKAPDFQKKAFQWLIGRNWALITMGNFREAKAGIDLAMKGKPPEAVFQSAVFRFAQRDFGGARTQLEQLLDQGVRDTRVASLFMETCDAQRLVTQCLSKLTTLATASDTSASLQHLIGLWHLRIGDSEGARKAFEAARATDRNSFRADLSLAEMDMNAGRYDSAIQRLDEVIAADPNNLPALFLVAQAETAKGNRQSAAARYRAILNVDASNVMALNNLAYVLAPDHVDEALNFAQKAAELAPENPTIQDTLGWVYYRKGFYQQAVQHLKTAAEKDSSPRRQYHLGKSYLRLGDEANGRRIVRQALQKDPNLENTESGW